MAAEAHVDFVKAIQDVFDAQTDEQYGKDPDRVKIDFSGVKLSHMGYKQGNWSVTPNRNVTVPSAEGETEIYFRASTQMSQSFRMACTHGNMEAPLEIPEEFRLSINSPSGQRDSWPSQITIPHIGDGNFEKTSSCPNSRQDGTRVEFEEITAKGEIVVYTHFHGSVKVTRGYEAPEAIPMQELLDDLNFLESNPQNKGSKFFVSSGLITLKIKRERAPQKDHMFNV